MRALVTGRGTKRELLHNAVELIAIPAMSIIFFLPFAFAITFVGRETPLLNTWVDDPYDGGPTNGLLVLGPLGIAGFVLFVYLLALLLSFVVRSIGHAVGRRLTSDTLFFSVVGVFGIVAALAVDAIRRMLERPSFMPTKSSADAPIAFIVAGAMIVIVSYGISFITQIARARSHRPLVPVWAFALVCVFIVVVLLRLASTSGIDVLEFSARCIWILLACTIALVVVGVMGVWENRPAGST